MESFGIISLGQGTPILVNNINDDVIVNGYSLQNIYITTSRISVDNEIDFSTYDYPRNNGRGLLGYYKRGKKISLDITIKGNSQEDLIKRVDELRKNVFQNEIYFDWRIGGKYRRIKASCISNPLEFNSYNISFLRTAITFETLEPFFYEIDSQVTSYLDKGSSFSQDITNLGYDEIDPIIYLLFRNVSGVNNIQIILGGNTLELNHTISTNDNIVINSESKTAEVNGVGIDYSGTFPILPKNTSFFTCNIVGDFTVDVHIFNKKVYV